MFSYLSSSFFFAGVVAVTDRNSHRHDGVHAHRIVARVSQIPISLGFSLVSVSRRRSQNRLSSTQCVGTWRWPLMMLGNIGIATVIATLTVTLPSERTSENRRLSVALLIFRRGGALGACQEPLGRTTT